MRFHELPSEPHVIRASASPYVVFGLIWGVLLVPGLAFLTQSAANLSVVALILFGLTLSFVWIASFKLVIAKGFISYRTLFTGTRSFALSEIERSDLAIGYETVRDRFKPPIRLVLQPRQSTGKKPISINLKVFSKPDVSWVMRVLGPEIEDEVEESW